MVKKKSNKRKASADANVSGAIGTDVDVLVALADQKSEERQKWWMEDMPDEVTLRDEDLIADVLEMDLRTLDDMVEYFCIEERLGDDEFTQWGPFKFQYDEGDFYDWYVALGCLNCGRPYEMYYHHTQVIDPPVLVCLNCGHRACPRHFDNESDSLVDRMRGVHLPSLNDDSNNNGKSGGANGVYLYGNRKNHNFGQFDKAWWQEKFLSPEYRKGRMVHHLRVVNTMGQKKGQTCQEECLLCGHDRAFYQLYQARSADEGMTIMFECCNCRNRKVFNN
eukprot:GHVQ01037572.1.p2 GENE.GHVQ01037572.1~~GHVQ01037572.1.p2  ORF type:complete len:278 (+),score=41.61 GHVQ01037572.1:227-1060(+)